MVRRQRQICGLADGYAGSGDIGAQAIVELADHSLLISAGAGRNEVYRFNEEGGESTQTRTTPLPRSPRIKAPSG